MTGVCDLIRILGEEKRPNHSVGPQESLTSVQKERIETIRSQLDVSLDDLCTKLRGYGCSLRESESASVWKLACHLFYLLLEIKRRLEASKEEQNLITDDESRQIENGILVAIEYGIRPIMSKMQGESSRYRLLGCAKILMDLMSIGQFFVIHPHNEFKAIVIYLLETIFTMQTCVPQILPETLDEMLKKTPYLLPKSEYFKIVFYIKGNREPSSGFQTAVHHHLLDCLVAPGGFRGICEVLIPSADGSSMTDDKLPPSWQCCAIISKIIAHKGHKKTFYSSIIDEICRFLVTCRKERGINPFFKVAAVRCLRSLYELPHKEVRDKIVGDILGKYDELSQPTDVLKGVILFDEEDFLNSIEMTCTAFCISGPSDTTLPSKLITPYLPLLVQLYSQFTIEGKTNLTSPIGHLIVKCLANRDKGDLKDLVEHILCQTYPSDMKSLHPRVFVHRKITASEQITFALQIGGPGNDDDEGEKAPDYDPSATLVKILKESSHNILIYDVFLHLLELFSHCISAPKNLSAQSQNNDLIADFEDLAIVIDKNFRKNYAIINALTELIAHKPFHNQFSENPQKLVELFENILRDRINFAKNAEVAPADDSYDEILLIILSLIQEFLHKISNQDQDVIKRLFQTLREFRDSQPHSDIISRKLEIILEPPSSKRMDYSPFVVAKTLIVESVEPHLKVYGMMEMIKLISGKDTESLANSHAILAVAMKMLKDSDSYVFLNCIKLLIALMNVMDSTVLDTLVAEYHQEDTVEEADIDFRLKVGETIVKVTEGLGPMSYKYKGTLINCFLRGGNHPQDEFRTSNLSNLGTICRILCYQVHQFFQELMTMVENIIDHDKYLPARRAAALILANLLTGIENLADYQECLLPIFKLLNRIAQNDEDRQIRVHAQNGLDQLKQKIKEFLMPERKMEKEIKIFGIKDEEEGSSKKKGHILEIV